MIDKIPVPLQTIYAELLDRAASAAFSEAFPEDGTFVSKTIKGKRYWYFQTRTDRKQRYVGPETEERLEEIRRHREVQDDRNQRSSLVATLTRSAFLPSPPREIGQVVGALSRAGVFRLRGVLVGTVAYQTYAGKLGVRLPTAIIQTGDIDVAQFADVSVAVADRTAPILDILKAVDQSFREVPHSHDSRRVATYQASSGIRVDFLTPNRGPDTDALRALPAFWTDAQQLRFLDFLIRDPEPAVILHDAGIYVSVPSPERYAVHKLIVARRRIGTSAKANKDIRQAEALFAVLSKIKPVELHNVWNEAFARGKGWKTLLGEGLGLLRSNTRDTALKIVKAPRSVIPDLDIQFSKATARYDFNSDVVSFIGEANGTSVRCAISREALDDHFGTDRLGKEGRLERVRERRSLFEGMVRLKYLTWPVEEPDHVLIRTSEVVELLRNIPKTLKRGSLKG